METVANKVNLTQSLKQWTPKQCNKTTQPKADMYITSNFSPFNCSYQKIKCCFVVWKKGLTPKIRLFCFVIINSVLFNPLCVWIFHDPGLGFCSNSAPDRLIEKLQATLPKSVCSWQSQTTVTWISRRFIYIGQAKQQLTSNISNTSL